jgi:hypothetical protein
MDVAATRRRAAPERREMHACVAKSTCRILTHLSLSRVHVGATSRLTIFATYASRLRRHATPPSLRCRAIPSAHYNSTAYAIHSDVHPAVPCHAMPRRFLATPLHAIR